MAYGLKASSCHPLIALFSICQFVVQQLAYRQTKIRRLNLLADMYYKAADVK